VSNTKKIKTTAISTILGMSLLLFLLGLLAYLLVLTNTAANEIKEQLVVDVYFRDDAREIDVRKLEKEILAMPSVESANYVSKDSAKAILMQQQGEDVFDILDGVVPLKQLIVVNLGAQYVNKDSAEAFKKSIASDNEYIIDEVFYNQSHFLEIGKSFKKLEIFLLIAAALLLIIAVLLINNTIRLAIFSKRFLIRTMQLVGAKSSFIRRPFLRSALAQGFISGIIAILLLLGAGYLLAEFNPQSIENMTETAEGYQTELILIGSIFGGLILSGMFISYFSTFFALNKYLWIKSDKLF
jgi:cell division transport system permease protein